MPKQKELPLSPQQVVLLGFAAVILVGGLLLSLPIASNGEPLSLLDGLFEATSAVCVTGLTVVDPATQFNLFGRILLALLIQLGGLGFATFSTFSAVLIGRRLGLRERIILQQSLNQDALQGLVRLARLIFLVTAIVEGAGAVVLTLGFWPHYGFWTALGYGVFHSISAFNNAGFDLFGGFRSLGGQPVWVDAVLCALLVLGGLGFT
ncbi:MAG TPA: potassium transporter TrkG, partial [Limnochordia bacterium]|nr:potassium transporter TrkG [Limnochordia bacterium]